MAAPGRGAHQFQGRFLERPGDEEAVHDLDGAQPVEDGPVRGERAHPQARRGGLGQRADVHDRAVRVVGDQRGRQRRRVLVDEAAREVVLDHERAGRAGDPQHLGPAPGGQYGTGGVLEQRLADEEPGPAGAERLGQQVGPYPVRVHRYGHGPQPGRAGGGQHARVRR